METKIRSAIDTTLKELGVSKADFTIEHPADLSHGDYATNAALVAMRKMESPPAGGPRELAEQLVAKLVNQIDQIATIEVAGPGFINFHLTREFYTAKILSAVKNKETWGNNETEAGEEVMIEYTSPNLFKPLHVGNLVGNIIGESIARLYESSGATVRRLNYPSDIGLTVAKGVWGLQKTGGDPSRIEDLGKAYVIGNEAYESGGDEKIEIEAVNRALYAGDNPELNELRKHGIETSRARLAELCRMLGTNFDAEIFESEAGPVGTALVQEGIQKGVFETSDGAVVYKGEKQGLHTRVFLNSQGLPTYEAKDLGNFKLKQERYQGWSQSFIVTGGEQKEYFKVIIAAIREIFLDAQEKRIEHIPTGFLTLASGKMSSRKGNVLTGESLLEELQEEAKKRAEESRAEDVDSLAEMIAVAALKFQILRHKVGSDIVFDKTQALSFEGDSGPYLQYTYARLLSVLSRVQEVGITPSVENAPKDPYILERIVYQFPEVIEHARIEHSPHFLVTYLLDLAGNFNTFYGIEKIADPSDEFAPYKAAVAKAVCQTLKNGLWLLGIKAPEEM